MTVTVSDGQKAVSLRKLNLTQIKRIDNMLEQSDEFGAVKLVVEKGVVKFAEVTVSKKI